MKLRWIPNVTLSLLRCIGRIDQHGQLPDAALHASFEPLVASISERLVTASVQPSHFWGQLMDEVVAADNEIVLSPTVCEIALLKAGVSQLQADQLAAAVYRGIESCRRVLLAKSPRLSEQLKLRVGPLQQSYQAYGPGLVRAVGQRIWNGPPPAAWWPSTVTVHAALPINAGAAGFASESTSIWIEAVLTDIEPSVPEWLRLVFQLSRLAMDAHTRIDSSVGDDSHSISELPWSLALVSIVLAEAAAMGAVRDQPLPIKTALALWLGQSDVASILSQWWNHSGQTSVAMPVALKQLTAMLSPSGSSRS